jgi:hypothetical protein
MGHLLSLGVVSQSSLFSLHLAVTWMLVGLIWVVQMVIYPQFKRVGQAEFVAFHFGHCWRIGLVVTPLIAMECLTAAGLWWMGQRGEGFVFSLALIPVVWLSTGLIQAPLHLRLMRGYDLVLIQRVTWTNWLRTLVWTLRGLVLLAA